MSTQQKSYEWHTATATDGRTTFHFASLDGEAWYPVDRLPEVAEREHAEQLEAIAKGTDRFKPMCLARRGIYLYTDLRDGSGVEFHEVVPL